MSTTGDGQSARITITYYARPAAGAETGDPRTVYADSPAASVQLVEVAAAAYADQRPPARVETQRDRLPRHSLTEADPIFGPSLLWPYRGVVLTAATADSTSRAESALPLGGRVPQPTTGPVPAPPSAEQRLCLFNVIVALEWYPDQREQRQLEWAFRRASDFLYDVSDGHMAFGQVVFGGPEWLSGADIQIMAANRFHPRSWTNGLHEAAKSMPIRLGRGIWSKTGRRTIPWDEPEAYRALIHEWAHYALGLKDEYLREVGVNPTTSYGPRLALAETAGRWRLVVPAVSLPIRSIMATQQGTSELMAHTGDRRPAGSGSARVDEWREISQKREFAFLRLPARHQPTDGPWELPLPLPSFHHLDQGDRESASGRQWRGEAWGGGARLRNVPDELITEHGWVYLLKGVVDRPTAVVAQGTLETAAGTAGFALLGAAVGDTIVIIGDDRQYRPRVWRTVITGRQDDGRASIGEWADATPTVWPTIDVLPRASADPSGPVDVAVRLGCPGGPLPERVTLLPVGAGSGVTWSVERTARASWTSPAGRVGTLDGHVVVTWGGGRQLMIATYSQGGGPASIGGVFDNPTTGGSAEGNAMVFFKTPSSAAAATAAAASSVRLVTTLNHGGPGRLPGIVPVEASHPHSYLFSLASNQALPAELHPTLILFYEPFQTEVAGDLCLYRDAGPGRWEPLPTYVDQAAWLVAAPLSAAVAGGQLLTADPLPAGAERVERFRLYWTRHDSQIQETRP